MIVAALRTATAIAVVLEDRMALLVVVQLVARQLLLALLGSMLR
jgi:hypothetical protein